MTLYSQPVLGQMHPTRSLGEFVMQYTIKFQNFHMPENSAVIDLKFKQRPNLRVFRQKDANGVANSEDPHQTAS